MNPYPTGLSLCMIVKNEAAFIADALRSVAGIVDELCIVDTGSTDDTIAIARAHGARVSEVAWSDDFAAARNASLAMATRRWILVLDADERLAPAARPLLAAVGSQPARDRGKWIVCRNLTDNHKGSGAMSNALVRIFPNDARIRYRNPIHEFVAIDGSDGGLPADRTPIEIIHHGYLSAIVRERGKAERNLRLTRAAALREPGDAFHHYNLGMAHVLAGDRDSAIDALERMRELTRATPRGFRIHGLIVLADLYAEGRGDLAAARGLIDECLTLVPNYSNAHFALGKILARGGDWYAARDAFGRAIAAGAHDGEHFVVDDEIAIWKAHSEIGATLMREGRHAQALAWFELAAQARPAVQALLINRAKCHEALGDLASAGALHARAFALHGDECSALEWINFLFRAGRAHDALAAIDLTLPVIGTQARPLVLGSAAAAHLRAGRADLAQDCVDTALAGPDRPAATAAVAALAEHFAMPELRALLPAAPRLRADGLRIAYAL